MRLSTYVSLLSTLLVVLACAVFCVIAVVSFDARPFVFLLIVPIGCVSFFLSLMIAYFVTQPLRDLSRLVRQYKAGDKTVKVSPQSSLYEVGELSRDIEDLILLSETSRDELTTLKQRQNEFISDIAHEFRTPLTAISGNTELMLDPSMPQETREHFCGIVLSETERLKKLTNSLLALQHIKKEQETFEVARVDLGEIARDVVELMAPITQDAHIALEIEGDAPDILANADRIKQALINLVDNAIHHVDEGGRIIIGLSGLKDRSLIAVKDDGCGFGDINPRLLFKRFYRADASRARNTGGSGLGLAIVSEIVEANDGTVRAYNAPEGGAIFLMSFPAIH